MFRVVAAVLLTLAAHGAVAAPGGFVRVDGRRFVNPDGSEFAIKGVSLGNWLLPEGYMFKFTKALSPREIDAVFQRVLGPQGAAQFWQRFRDNYITEADIAFIRAAGFNTVRVPLHYGLFMRDGDPPVFEGPGWPLIDRLIGWCRAHGLHVILDMHAAPGGQTGVNHDDGSGFPLVFYVPRYRRETIELWRRIAARYRDETAVLGYDLLNEPISPYNDEDLLNPRLEPLYRDILAAIRQVDPNHVAFLEAAQWATNISVFGPPFAANVAYSYHKFWAHPGRDSVQDYLDYAARYDVPIVLGESGEMTDGWNAAFRSLNERFGIGWCFWPYKEPDSTSVSVSIPLPAGWDEIAAVGSAASLDRAPAVPGAKAITDAFLVNLRFAHDRVNRSYLASLGLGTPHVAAREENVGRD
ncbi:MAG TPA: cellulase family glycosylhydrolase [Acetobacteraceae bacterium]|nr:cellulase family glycosylhydrolase [Acetobacteraceae bacterium]